MYVAFINCIMQCIATSVMSDDGIYIWPVWCVVASSFVPVFLCQECHKYKCDPLTMWEDQMLWEDKVKWEDKLLWEDKVSREDKVLLGDKELLEDKVLFEDKVFLEDKVLLEDKV